ncbi:MAG: Hsp20/alpha crystallin family protein [Methanoregula sp.]|nr:Hsp20/alpha crystallin family protein [Methanoregula sp.]
MERKKVKKDEPVLDFGLKFGGILTELGNFTQDITRMVEEGKTEMTRTGEISFDKSRKLKGMYGVSVRMGGDGMPRVDTFGRRPESETREPIVDVFDEADRLQVIVELPGVEEKDISIELKNSTLLLTAGKGERKYKKEIDLGVPVKGEPKKQYKNGILEINLKKA